MTRLKVISSLKFVSVMMLVSILSMVLTSPVSHVLAVEEAKTIEKKTEVSVEFKAGELTLEGATPISFGSHIITAEEASERSYKAAADTVIKVSDLRGNFAGWSLVASLSKFKMGEVSALPGAYITLSNQDIYTPSQSKANAPTNGESPIKLNSGGSTAPVMKAAAGGGMGVWNSNWAQDDIILTVVSGTEQTGISLAEITWSLQDAP